MDLEKAWTHYDQALPRRLITLSRYLQRESMKQLKETYQHPNLRIYFEPYIYSLGVKGYRLTELAGLLSVSKQACNQTLDKLETLNYITRKPDEQDGRAKQVVLTKQGNKLVEDGVHVSLALDQQAIKHIKKTGLKNLQAALRQLAQCVDIPSSKMAIRKYVLKSTDALLMQLPRLEQYTREHLTETLFKQGYEKIKPSHLDLLDLLGVCKGYVKQIALMQEVSHQTVTAIAKDFERLGFIEQKTETLGGRQIKLVLTKKGERLLADMNSAQQDLEKTWQQYLDEDQFALLTKQINTLYEGLGLTQGKSIAQSRVQALAEQLTAQLNEVEVQELGHLLLGSGKQ